MAIKTKSTEETPAQDTTSTEKKVRGDMCKIGEKEYFIRTPKGKDMIAIEHRFLKTKSSYEQALILVDYLCEEITLEELKDMYADELTDVFNVFEKIFPAAPNAPKRSAG
jgi:uncharacterized protein with gpF-like domain